MSAGRRPQAPVLAPADIRVECRASLTPSKKRPRGGPAVDQSLARRSSVRPSTPSRRSCAVRRLVKLVARRTRQRWVNTVAPASRPFPVSRRRRKDGMSWSRFHVNLRSALGPDHGSPSKLGGTAPPEWIDPTPSSLLADRDNRGCRGRSIPRVRPTGESRPASARPLSAPWRPPTSESSPVPPRRGTTRASGSSAGPPMSSETSAVACRYRLSSSGQQD